MRSYIDPKTGEEVYEEVGGGTGGQLPAWLAD
jgi:hypothetical protein